MRTNSWSFGDKRVAEWILETTDADIEAALERARKEPPEVLIAEAQYHRDLDLFVLKLTDGRRLVYPREDLQPVANATPEEAADFTTGPRGSHLWWNGLDAGLHLDSLLEGRTGNEKWMERLQRHGVAA
jgi:hypothetical protein